MRSVRTTGCVMAGSFGFEAEHYEWSKKIAERHLIPAVKSSDHETLVIADGFSCRTQIRDFGGRNALHLSEVIAQALHIGYR